MLPRIAATLAPRAVARCPARRPASTTTVAPITSIEELAKRAAYWKIRHHLEEDTRAQISDSEFQAICAQHNVGAAEAEALLQKFNDTGIVFKFGPDGLVFIKPREVLRSAHALLNIPFDLSVEHRQRIQQLREELRPLELRKQQIDDKIRRSVNRFWAFSCGALGVQMAVLARLTFVDFDWDIMEPVTYFLTTGTATLCFAYFAFHRSEYTYTELEGKMMTKRQMKHYTRGDFDFVKYSQLADQLAEEEKKVKEEDE
eukprot:TRINITY_DN33160_c0_g1_i1.p1 TRINITY_DN33160_c0_g1~~TRINITY_DN33160_c0_g1_i1.p1  ORF type:complete len:258 (+),score=67.42 TRINITY_DN33160_c0_g1_i1:41-814(+)